MEEKKTKSLERSKSFVVQFGRGLEGNFKPVIKHMIFSFCVYIFFRVLPRANITRKQ